METRYQKAKRLQARMKRMQEKGKTVREIAKSTGKSIGTVHNYLNNVQPKPPKVKKKPRKRLVSPEQKEKNRDRQYKYRYGISLEDYRNMYREQGGMCPICMKIKPISGKYKMHVDHCHETNKVRGLLCSACNTNLGKFNDSIDMLERAIYYLKEAKVP